MDFVEIRETEDASGRLVAGEAQSMTEAAAESVAALSQLTAKIKARCDSMMAEEAVSGAAGRAPGPGAPPAAAFVQSGSGAAEAEADAAAAAHAIAQAPEKVLGDHDELMRRLSQLEAEEAASGRKAARARSTVSGDAWGSGFFKSRGAAAPRPGVPSTENAEKLMALREPRAPPSALGEAPAAATARPGDGPAAPAKAPARAPAKAPAASSSWKKGFFQANAAPSQKSDKAPARHARAAPPKVGGRKAPFKACVSSVKERPSVSERPSAYAPLADELERDRPFPGPRLSNGAPIYPVPAAEPPAARAPAAGDAPTERPRSLFAEARAAMRDLGEDTTPLRGRVGGML